VAKTSVTTGVTVKEIFEKYCAVPPNRRASVVWVMSLDTLDEIKNLPEVQATGPAYYLPGLLLGRPIEMDPDADGFALVDPKERPA
jgi:hypothetical protein